VSEGTVEQVIAREASWCIVTGVAWEHSWGLLPDGCADVCCTDPPYSKAVHDNVRSAGRGDMPDVAEFECRTRRQVDLHFEYLTAADRRRLAAEMARITKFWNLVFSDTESAWLWKMSLQARGMDYTRTAFWDRLGGAPSFHGNYPSPALEAITLTRNEKRSWNGGGKRAHYTHPIVANRKGQQGSRLNEAQKPLKLMMDLMVDFAEVGDLVVDFTCGSGTTGHAALLRGCRGVGFEKRVEMAETARERLRALTAGSTIQAARAGQTALFGGAR
jgi:site-specific DNA-methyltransferase (adenine-specific)